MAATEMKRIRISVPLDDKDVLTWLASQQSISMSIRELVRDAVETHGTGDYFSSGRERINRMAEPHAASQGLVRPQAAAAAAASPAAAENQATEPVQQAQASPAGDSAREKILRMQGILNG